MVKSIFLGSVLLASSAFATPPCVVTFNELGQKITCCSQADGSQCCSDAVDDKGQPLNCEC